MQKIPFKNKGVKLFDLPRIFNHTSVIFSIPEELPNFETTSVMTPTFTCLSNISSGQIFYGEELTCLSKYVFDRYLKILVKCIT